ncbi:MAG: class I SAM-dependent methyltransferase family protein [Promethearchaeota archaeon]
MGDQVSPELLPRRLRILGHVGILWLHPQLEAFKELIGQTTLEYDTKIKSVLRRTDAITGPYRQPAVELIAGSPETETVFNENRVVFHIDPMKVMFSVGNKSERLRMSQLGSGEFVVDMFAGIGQLSLPMAVHSRPKIVHAIEWNPDAFNYLKQNIQANKVSNIIFPYLGDTAVITPTICSNQADRVIMGLIQGTGAYLRQGLECICSGGIMHVHEIGPKEDSSAELFSKMQKLSTSMNRSLELVESRIIKTYSPRYNHFVLDVRVFKG